MVQCTFTTKLRVDELADGTGMIQGSSYNHMNIN